MVGSFIYFLSLDCLFMNIAVRAPVLLEKLSDGTIRPYKGGEEFDLELTDGSLNSDIPSQGLAEMFNATFFLVNQV